LPGIIPMITFLRGVLKARLPGVVKRQSIGSDRAAASGSVT
jgi:hypothetical protein